MSDSLSSRYRRNLPGDTFADAQERIFGWRCRFCKERTKEAACPTCNQEKEDASM